MTRRLLLPSLVAAAFLGGVRLARGEGGESEVVRTLVEQQKLLAGDLKKIEQACKDVIDIRKARESGEFVLNAEEKKLERQGREDFHIFMERFRNGTLEVLEILDHVVHSEDFVDPLRRIYGRALDQPVEVAWQEEDLDLIIGEISEKYGVPINISGEMDRRKTLSLNGEMSLLAILLQLENVFDGKFVVRDGNLWIALVETQEEPPGPEERPKIPESEKSPPPKKG
jgi:hypothetical protein